MPTPGQLGEEAARAEPHPKQLGEAAMQRRAVDCAALLDAAHEFFKWFDKSGEAISARWDRVPREERVRIVEKFRAALARAEAKT